MSGLVRSPFPPGVGGRLVGSGQGGYGHDGSARREIELVYLKLEVVVPCYIQGQRIQEAEVLSFVG